MYLGLILDFHESVEIVFYEIFIIIEKTDLSTVFVYDLKY